MMKTIEILLVVAMVTAAAVTFKIKYEAEALEVQVASFDRKAQLERETIALLDADWSLLNQPDRLQRLADAFKSDLALEPLKPEQIVEPHELPLKPVAPVSNDIAALIDADGKTGSVKAGLPKSGAAQSGTIKSGAAKAGAAKAGQGR